MRFVFALCLFAAACGNNKATGDGGPGDAGVDSPPDASCFMNPQTHEEIINACTNAQKYYKDSHPPLMKPNGVLPPLPQ